MVIICVANFQRHRLGRCSCVSYGDLIRHNVRIRHKPILGDLKPLYIHDDIAEADEDISTNTIIVEMREEVRNNSAKDAWLHYSVDAPIAND